MRFAQPRLQTVVLFPTKEGELRPNIIRGSWDLVDTFVSRPVSCYTIADGPTAVMLGQSREVAPKSRPA